MKVDINSGSFPEQHDERLDFLSCRWRKEASVVWRGWELWGGLSPCRWSVSSIQTTNTQPAVSSVYLRGKRCDFIVFSLPERGGGLTPPPPPPPSDAISLSAECATLNCVPPAKFLFLPLANQAGGKKNRELKKKRKKEKASGFEVLLSESRRLTGLLRQRVRSGGPGGPGGPGALWMAHAEWVPLVR